VRGSTGVAKRRARDDRIGARTSPDDSVACSRTDSIVSRVGRLRRPPRRTASVTPCLRCSQAETVPPWTSVS